MPVFVPGRGCELGSSLAPVLQPSLWTKRRRLIPLISEKPRTVFIIKDFPFGPARCPVVHSAASCWPAMSWLEHASSLHARPVGSSDLPNLSYRPRHLARRIRPGFVHRAAARRSLRRFVSSLYRGGRNGGPYCPYLGSDLCFDPLPRPTLTILTQHGLFFGGSFALRLPGFGLDPCWRSRLTALLIDCRVPHHHCYQTLGALCGLSAWHPID